MIRRIDHISIAVRDLEKARNFFLNILGGKELFSAPVSQQKFRWTTIELGTSCFIELIDPLEKDGFVHRFLETRGEGPHHVTIQVDDLKEIHRILEEKGIPTFGYAEPFPVGKSYTSIPKTLSEPSSSSPSSTLWTGSTRGTSPPLIGNLPLRKKLSRKGGRWKCAGWEPKRGSRWRFGRGRRWFESPRPGWKTLFKL